MINSNFIPRCAYLSVFLVSLLLAAGAGQDVWAQTEVEQPVAESTSESLPAEASSSETDIAPGGSDVPTLPVGPMGGIETTTEPEVEVMVEGGGAIADPATAKQNQAPQWYVLLGIVFAVIPLPFILTNWLAKRLKMPDHAWKMGLATSTIAAATVITVLGWPPKLGTDLSGGVNLIYELDKESNPDNKPVDMDRLIKAISRRVNPGGVKEVTIRQYGSDVEIIIPRADEAEIDLIKRHISTAGSLEFRITANENDPNVDPKVIEQARQTQGKRVELERDGQKQVVARWVRPNMKEFDSARNTDLVTRQNQRGEWEVLVLMDHHNVTGEYLVTSTSGIDEGGRPAVNFTFNTAGAQRFGNLTGENTPIAATGFYRNLGIVLDDELMSHPRINERISQRGQISGNFNQEEVDFIISILNAGSLPAALNKQPISDQTVTATLGADTVEKGSRAITISIIGVLGFMLVYYQFAGLVACLALTANLVLILAVMICIKAAFTLPGLAGLVLTVGMAVDANVLIFERIREELARGAAFRMAIRDGFGRATTTIVDANLTTLITAIVLYWIGTDQIRGFAVTLILGIVMSMYTAIFCSRIVFDIAERQQWVKKMSMLRLIGKTKINFVGQRYVAAVLSVVVISVGMLGVFGRGADLLDIDFTGGTSVMIALNEGQQMKTADVRQFLSDQEGLADVAVVGVGDGDLQFKISTSNRDIDDVQKQLREVFGDRLQTNSLTYSDLKLIDAHSTLDSEAASSDGEAAKPTDYQGGTSAKLVAGVPVKQETLAQLLDESLDAANVAGIQFEVDNPKHVKGSEKPFQDWDLKMALAPQQTEAILKTVGGKLAVEPVFPSSSNIGGKVAGDTQAQAGYALFFSLLAIVGYLWLRFQRIMFGLAAVVALIHDVLVTLGVVALSAYFVSMASPAASLLLIDPFKISLPIVAAFLTIIGYSLNDTIVVFDRIREVRGKSPDLTAEMINTSINQTLNRTLLTSLTTLIVVLILYVIGGPGIHGFAYALVIGVMVGTYSSIFVASPVLLWMGQSSGPRASRSKAKAQPAKAGVG